MHPKGFTLIELLVVVAVIGVISAVAMSSFQVARSRAQDAGVRAQAAQLRTILEQELNATGSYTNIKQGGGWYGVGDTCNPASPVAFSGEFAARAAQVCAGLVRAAGTPCGIDGCVYFRTVDLPGGTTDSPTHYSIVAYLQGVSRMTGTATFLCIGSSGRSSQTVDPFSLASPGCYDNP